MTDRLRMLLTEAAEAAGTYVDAGHAVRAARRRRAGVAATGTVAVVLVILAGAAVVGLVNRPGPPAPAAGPPRYPATVSTPARAGDLPAGRVGTAALIYAPCPLDCTPYLVLGDGRQYRLAKAGRGEATATYTLSPDGRWLGYPTAGGFELRNLAAGTVRRLSDSGPGESDVWAWAPDSTWCLLVRHVDGAVDHLQAVDVMTGATHRLDADPGTPLAIREDGTVIYLSPAGQLTVDPPTGITPDLHALLHPGETVQPGNFLLGTGDRGAFVVDKPQPTDAAGRPTALLTVDLTSGRMVARTDLPASGGSGELWEPRAVTATGFLMVHWTSGETQIADLDPASGAVTVLSHLPRDAQVVLPGTRR